ncbi:MAG: tripartite tricarboxylate transporter substrate binding protein [Proteobacteria bacterium]|nr:tripartite tricarboxylate transporter substrate binding protein [Burkholderiales bacterium]
MKSRHPSKKNLIETTRSALATMLWLPFVSLALLATSTMAQAPYPSKPVRLIVPVGPGGGYDFIARLLGARLSEAWGQGMLIENRPGANGNIGSELVARSAPDGYTLLMGGIGPQALSVGLYPNLAYDPVRDFEAISLVAVQPNLLAVHSSVPVKSLKEFIEFAKARPGQIAYASNGSGSPQHLAAEQLKILTGIDITHVPFKGAGPALTALISGEVAVAFNVIISPIPHVRTGKLRALGVASARRSSIAPEVPTLTELGFPIEIDTWYGLYAPTGTPKDVIARISADTMRIATLPEVREKASSQGIEMIGASAERLAAHTRSEIARWSKVIKQAKLTID